MAPKHPRAHGATQPNTSTVTFRYPSGSPLVIKVHGRRTEVDARIRLNVEQRKQKMTFWDLNQAKNVKVDLHEIDSWSVR